MLCAALCLQCAFAVQAQVQRSAAIREQTDLDISVVASDDVNPDDKGRAAPILVRLYELRAVPVFEAADYFSLDANDKTVLGSDLLARDEIILRPGDLKTIRRKSHHELGAIAVIAGYRELGQAEWRAVYTIEPAPKAAWYRIALPARKARLRIELQGHGVRIIPLE